MYEFGVESSGCGMWEAAADVKAWKESTIGSCKVKKTLVHK